MVEDDDVPVIDQRILIPAAADAVWLYLNDPALVSRWNRSAKQVSLLSTRMTGVGVRRRVTDASGKSVVEEITAWQENLGYEYTVIDGSYKAFKGRLRLQSVAEGTLVYWTVEYRLRGLFAGLRIGRRRRMVRQISDSLLALRRVIEASGVRLDPERQRRYAMQADPGLAARQARMNQPTPLPMPSSKTGTGEISKTPAFAKAFIGEDDIPELPPASATVPPPTSFPTSVPTSVPTNAPQPIPTILGVRTAPPPIVAAIPAPTVMQPPAPLIVEPPIDPHDTRPSAVPTPAEPPRADAPDSSFSNFPTVPLELVAPKRGNDAPPTETQNIVLPPVEDTSLAERNATRAEPAPTRSMPPPPPDEPAIEAPPSLPEQPNDVPKEKSIWERFGVDKPVENLDFDALVASLRPKLLEEPPRPAFELPDPDPSESSLVSAPPVLPLFSEPVPPRLFDAASPPESAPNVFPELPPALHDEPYRSEPPRPASRQHGIFLHRATAEKPPRPVFHKSGVKVRAAHAPQHTKVMLKIRRPQ